jgi:hypothetical protein
MIYDLIGWTIRIFILNHENFYRFVKRRIFRNFDAKRFKLLLKIFTNNYIGADGIFILRLIECNSNAGIISELLDKIWCNFKSL